MIDVDKPGKILQGHRSRRYTGTVLIKYFSLFDRFGFEKEKETHFLDPFSFFN